MSAFLMVSLFADPFNQAFPLTHQQFAQQVGWNAQSGWQHWLNNLRLIIQPLIAFNTLKPWLEVFPLPSLSDGLALLTQHMQRFCCPAVLNLTPLLLISSA
jgi:hypothetical protein